MHLFIEKGMTSGIYYIAKRNSKANNKHMICYDRGKQNKYITCLDANDLYGYAMSQYLPYSENQWLNRKEIKRFDVNSIGENSSVDYILEVDLNYRDGLHKLHYPLAPEKLEISQNMPSKYCSNFANEHGIQIGGVNN